VSACQSSSSPDFLGELHCVLLIEQSVAQLWVCKIISNSPLALKAKWEIVLYPASKVIEAV